MDRIGPNARLHALDVLRGIALVGMFVVHFSIYATGGGPVGEIYQKAVALLFEERFWAMFGILFGAGFAIQFQRAEARGENYLPKYLRRLAALAVIGFIAHGILGFNVLLGYAAWGLALPLVRRWSTPWLVVAVMVSAASGSLYVVARTWHGVSTKGVEAFEAERRDAAAATQAFIKANNAAQDSADFLTVVKARLQKMPWFYSRPFSFLPVNTLTLFLLGLLGIRLGLFDRPGEHRRLILALMVFGVGSWAFENWAPFDEARARSPHVRETTVALLAGGFGLIRAMWLSFTYIGAVLLLVASNAVWLRRLAVFGWAGRTALTSYMLQIVILDLTFSNYALGLSLTPLVGLVAASVLFLILAGFSRWWLSRHPYGPLEWLWRSATYARWQTWAAVAVLLLVAGCSAPGNPKVPAGAKSSGGLHGVIETDKGPIEIEFFPSDAPKAVENFRLLAEHGYYDGLTFHRIVRGFMIQGGDPSGDGTGGQSAWGPPFEDEINPESALYRGGYRRSLIAMANAGPNTNGSQFFILHRDYPLPPRYVIFARVTNGMDVVDAIAGTDTSMGADGNMSKPTTPPVIKTITIRP